MRKDGDFMDIYACKAGAEVIGVPIHSVYPNYMYNVLRPDMHRVFQPMNGRDSRMAFIMWTRTDGVKLEPVKWKPNHFVLLLPQTRYFSIIVFNLQQR